ncbi:DUF1328 domain-containing protein [Desulfocurvibacter africanus]|uniref:DUF1328 domain-containing protein n=1 Tax=Desulfocurvibacter africanus TaxID=873 RepID=UPI002FD8A03C
MLKWALIFFLLSIVFGFFGFTGAARFSKGVAKFLVVLFVIMLLLAILFIVLAAMAVY